MSTYGIIYLVVASFVFIGFACYMQYNNKKLERENELLKRENESLQPKRDEKGRFVKV